MRHYANAFSVVRTLNTNYKDTLKSTLENTAVSIITETRNTGKGYKKEHHCRRGLRKNRLYRKQVTYQIVIIRQIHLFAQSRSGNTDTVICLKSHACDLLCRKVQT